MTAIHANASIDGEDLIVKIGNFAKEPRTVTLDVKGWGPWKYARQTLLTAAHPMAGNSIENPCAVAPRDAMVPSGAPIFAPAHSLQILRIGKSHCGIMSP